MNLFRSFANWLIARITRRPPDFVIGDREDPYLRRWWVIPRNPVFNIYLHQILKSDQDRALHCHPWVNLSVILWGSYLERLPKYQTQATGFDYTPGFTRDVLRETGSISVRMGHWRHRLILSTGEQCWSLFFTGPVYRRWGFHCRTGWVYWRNYVDPKNKGVIGAGCGDAYER